MTRQSPSKTPAMDALNRARAAYEKHGVKDVPQQLRLPVDERKPERVRGRGA